MEVVTKPDSPGYPSGNGAPRSPSETEVAKAVSQLREKKEKLLVWKQYYEKMFQVTSKAIEDLEGTCSSELRLPDYPDMQTLEEILCGKQAAKKPPSRTNSAKKLTKQLSALFRGN
ncbi:unnamed protein product [Cyprideis torosa]|uniref:Uncharacterized protein n=1 Tax=Cyprideis torosa TaxID=163714 RepID=A0A7R8WD33_9CRUS|nr:unnamed protein product [Cyprideis torosa]CAG0894122.1 unnamed protein product [Cyprideis torosa]